MKRCETYSKAKAYFTPGGIFRTESRFRDDVATKSLRIVYIERRKPKIELRHVDQERSTQSSFFDLIGGKDEAEFFATKKLKWFMLFRH